MAERLSNEKETIIAWALFAIGAIVIFVALLYAIRKSYSNAQVLESSTSRAQEAYEEIFGEELR